MKTPPLSEIMTAFLQTHPIESVFHDEWLEEFAHAQQAILNPDGVEDPEEMEKNQTFNEKNAKLVTVRDQLLAVMQMNNLNSGEGIVVMLEFCLAVLALTDFAHDMYRQNKTVQDMLDQLGLIRGDKDENNKPNASLN